MLPARHQAPAGMSLGDHLARIQIGRALLWLPLPPPMSSLTHV